MHRFSIRMRMLLIPIVCFLVIATTAIVHNAVPARATGANAVSPRAASAISNLAVSVGYAEDKHQTTLSPAAFPVPWEGSPNIIFLGNPVQATSECGTLPHCFDAGAIRLDNTGTSDIKVGSVSVNDHASLPGGKVFKLWGSFTVPAGKSVILTENPPHNNPSYDNFDTSGAPKGNCTPLTVAPKVTITIGGVRTTLVDSTHVLDTGGIDQESCPKQLNESIQWRQIGTQGGKKATLSLSPALTTLVVGQQVTETAKLLDGSGNPLANANVNFAVTNGPDAGQTGSAVTDQTGKASFTYTNTASGTDIVIASINTAYTVGPFLSNQTAVSWTTDGSPATWTGEDIGNPALVGSDSLNNGTWTISGSGTYIGGTSDQFHYVWQPLVGQGGIRARVVTETNTNSDAMAGVMFRQSTDADAPFYAVVVTPLKGIFVLDRTSTGGNAHTLASITGAVPVYLQVERSGTTYTAYTSSDGTTWTPISGSSAVLSPAGTWLAGMAVTSHTATKINTATFDTVSTP